MVAPPHPTKHAETASAKEMAERATRVAAMLDRWDSEDVSNEPDWNVEDLEPIKLRHGPARDHQSKT
jgi:hypothetical protein